MSGRDAAFYLLILLVMIFSISAFMHMEKTEDPTYSQIRQMFEQEKVESFSIEDDVLTMTVRGDGDARHTVEYPLHSFSVFYEDFNDLVVQQYHDGVITQYDYPAGWVEPWWFAYLPYLMILVVFGVFWYMMYLRQAGAGGGGGLSRRTPPA